MYRAHELRLPTASAKKQHASKSEWNSGRAASQADFFTIGYSGRTTNDFISVLRQNEVKTLLDVRTHAISVYKPDFSKGNLRRRLIAEGFVYEHYPELGVPRDIRAKAIEFGARDVIWEWYDAAVVASYVGDNLHRFFNSSEHPVAFMCSELDPQECHRHRLCLALEKWGLKGFDL